MPHWCPFDKEADDYEFVEPLFHLLSFSTKLPQECNCEITGYLSGFMNLRSIILPFGQYKATAISDVPDGYVPWLAGYQSGKYIPVQERNRAMLWVYNHYPSICQLAFRFLVETRTCRYCGDTTLFGEPEWKTLCHDCYRELK